MISGGLLGIAIGMIPAIFIGLFIYNILSRKYDWIGIVIGVLIEIISIFTGTYIGIQYDRMEYNKKIENWKNTKTLLETTIKDENISDFSKIDLIDKTISYNMQLTELKEEVKQWWYFYLDDSKVEELELIDITEVKR